jgi:hypothetical protein
MRAERVQDWSAQGVPGEGYGVVIARTHADGGVGRGGDDICKGMIDGVGCRVQGAGCRVDELVGRGGDYICNGSFLTCRVNDFEVGLGLKGLYSYQCGVWGLGFRLPLQMGWGSRACTAINVVFEYSWVGCESFD